MYYNGTVAALKFYWNILGTFKGEKEWFEKTEA